MQTPEKRLKRVRFAHPGPGAKRLSADPALEARVLVPATASLSPKHPPPPSITSLRPTTPPTLGDYSYISQTSPLSFCAIKYDRYDATHLECVLDNVLVPGSVPMSAATAPAREPEVASPHAVLGTSRLLILFFYR